jgi:hypothetical protein
MTDRELLELAAKAAGYTGTVNEFPSGYVEMGLSNHFEPDGSNVWAPIHNDGQALRLAVKLGFSLSLEGRIAMVHNGIDVSEERAQDHDSDPYAATRRAIVRAAAEIGAKQ